MRQGLGSVGGECTIKDMFKRIYHEIYNAIFSFQVCAEVVYVIPILDYLPMGPSTKLPARFQHSFAESCLQE